MDDYDSPLALQRWPMGYQGMTIYLCPDIDVISTMHSCFSTIIFCYACHSYSLVHINEISTS